VGQILLAYIEIRMYRKLYGIRLDYGV